MTPGARPERERNAEGKEQRKRVPEADGLAQASPAQTVLEQRRIDLSGKGPDGSGRDRNRQDRREHERGTPHEHGEEEPDTDEAEVGETTVEVAPGQVGSQRPGHAEAAPQHKKRQGGDRDEPEPRESRQRQGPGERERTQRAHDAQRADADPDDGA